MLNGDLPPESQSSHVHVQRDCQTFMTSFSFWSIYGTDVCLTFFDLWQSTPPPTLKKLLKDIKLEQHVLQWLKSYLSDKQQYVVVDGATSITSPVLSGVPQGSVLGPLLYLIYINCVCLVLLSEGSMFSMYADDILLCKPIHHPENYDNLQRHWCHPWMHKQWILLHFALISN